jgi:Fic family protein
MFVEAPPYYSETFLSLEPDRLRLVSQLRSTVAPTGYLHWDKLRRLEPPGDLSHVEWWIAIRWGRDQRRLPLEGPYGAPTFFYTLPDAVFRLLHYVDQHCAGEVKMDEVVTGDEGAKGHYLVNSLMEEAIRSSQLEGATTSRQAAKELLRSGREPVDRSERMIVNNQRGLTFMRDDMGDRLTPALVLELHRILTEGTLDDPTAAGRLQTVDDDRVAVHDRDGGRIVHVPPPAQELPGRLQALCDFANADADAEPFIHPVLRAMLLHFWLAYDHPFADGNGRTARALFYWSMRTSGYWLVEYLSISRIFRDAPAKYMRAFLYSETDEGDTTYFLLHHLEVIERAVEELFDYLRRKMREVRDVEQLLADASAFNHRQLALLSDALRHPERAYALGAHAASHRVTHETARTDLSQLVELGLLERRRSGRSYRFSAAPDLGGRLQRLPQTG